MPLPITFETATASGVTLDTAKLVVTSTGGSGSGARVAAADGQTTGKRYYEITLTTETGGADTGMGIATTGSTYSAMGNNATAGASMFLNGGIYANSTNSGFGVGNPTNGHVIGIAVDLTARKVWFRNWAFTTPAVGSGWNGINSLASQDPSTGAGGLTIPAGTMTPLVQFNLAGNVFTANFGATAFSGTVPTGYIAGWLPAAPAAQQYAVMVIT